jgi:hypothetical protein
MPAVSVNFLRRRRQKVVRSRKLDRRLLEAAAVVAVIAVLVTGAVFAYSQILGRQLADTARQQRAAQALVNQQAGNEAAYLLFAERLGILDGILAERGSQRRALAFLSQLTTSELTFDRINFGEEEQKLNFRVQAQNVLSVENLVARLREPDIRAQFTDLALSNIRRDETRLYSIEVQVDLAPVEGGKSGT